jgi:hypothetical protein
MVFRGFSIKNLHLPKIFLTCYTANKGVTLIALEKAIRER